MNPSGLIKVNNHLGPAVPKQLNDEGKKLQNRKKMVSLVHHNKGQKAKELPTDSLILKPAGSLKY